MEESIIRSFVRTFFMDGPYFSKNIQFFVTKLGRPCHPKELSLTPPPLLNNPFDRKLFYNQPLKSLSWCCTALSYFDEFLTPNVQACFVLQQNFC